MKGAKLRDVKFRGNAAGMPVANLKSSRSPDCASASLTCPNCEGGNVRVIDSRAAPGLISGNTVRRRRACSKCNHRWTTLELTDDEIKSLSNGMIEHKKQIAVGFLVQILESAGMSEGEIIDAVINGGRRNA